MSETDTLSAINTNSNPYNSLRKGLHDHLSTIAPFTDKNRFVGKSTEIIGYLTYKIKQCGLYFSTAPFLQFMLLKLLSVYTDLSTRKILKGQITFWSALSHGFLGTVSESMIAVIKPDDSDDNANANTTSISKD